MTRFFSLLSLLSLCSFTACSDRGNTSTTKTPPDEADFSSGTEIRITVPGSGRVFVDLGKDAEVTPSGDPKASLDWDLAFEGFDVFTNGGVSAEGQGAAFGPVGVDGFIGDTAPDVPFLTEDRAGGAFLGWYEYDGTNHSLWSRYHTYGVKDGDSLWKVQVLTYYGKRDGAVISGIYSVRYASLAPTAGPVTTLDDVDGTAGGTAAPDDAASGCLDLGTGERPAHTPDVARESEDWHLCFRRDSISVNGEIGGPRGVGAVDLDSSETESEDLTTIKARTADGEAGVFGGVADATFDGKRFRGDRVVSAFGDAWTEDSQSKAWLVRGRDGTSKYLLVFSSFESATESSPGTILMYVKPVKG